MNKKVLLLPIIGSFLLTGCKLNLFGKVIYLFEQPPEKEQETIIIDGGGAEDIHTHAVSMSSSSSSPNAPFYLKVGETKQLGVTLSPAPELANEKTVTWSLDNEGIIEYTVDETETKKVTVTGAKEGTVKLTATNDYNASLSYTFTIKVINFDEDKEYLWQFDSEDRKSFGYIYQTRPEGIAEGYAVLNGISWHFTRSNVVTLQSSMGGIGFGKGGQPETHVHLETDTLRGVEKFIIEAASANSQGKMTIKVGDTVYMNEMTVPSDYYDTIRTINSDPVEVVGSGKIEIDVYTPEYVPELDGTSGYKKPGAFYLKSIWIKFAEDPEPASEVTYDYKKMYDDQEEGFYDRIPDKGKGTTVTFTDETFSVTFNKIQKESDSVPGYATTNGDIIIKPLKENEVFYKVEAKFNFGTLSTKNSYSVEKSKTDGLTYSSTGISVNKETGVLIARLSEVHANVIRLKPSNSSYIGIETLTITTLPGTTLNVKGFEVPEQFEPDKKEYYVGEQFDPTGLPDLAITFQEEDIAPEAFPASQLTWYDGPSYDANPSKATTVLELGTTKVYGIYNNEKIAEVIGLTILDDPKNITLVKSVDDIDETSHYYLVARQQNRFLRGSAGGSVGSGTAGVGQLEDAGEEITLSGAYRNDYYQFEIGDGKYAIKSTTGHYIGMTTKGGLSRNTDPNIKEFTLTMDPETYVLTMKFEYQPEEGDPIIRYIAFGTTAMSSLSTSEKANFSLYKVIA